MNGGRGGAVPWRQRLLRRDPDWAEGVPYLTITSILELDTLLEAMAAGVSVDTIIRTMHVHPTVSELVPTLLGDLKPLI